MLAFYHMNSICTIPSYPSFCNPIFSICQTFNDIQAQARVTQIFFSILYGAFALLSSLLPLGLLGSIGFAALSIHSLIKGIAIHYRPLPAAQIENGILPLSELSEPHCAGFATRDGIDSHRWKLELIRAAKHSIFLSGCYCGGRSFDEALDVMRDEMRIKPELKTSILASEMFITEQNRMRINAMKEEFPTRFEVVETPEIFPYLSERDELFFTTQHTKALMIDYGSAFLVGGSGMVSPWAEQRGVEPAMQKEVHGFFYDSILSMKAFRDMDFVFLSPLNSAGGRLYLEMARIYERFGGSPLDLGEAEPIEFLQAIPALRLATFASGPDHPNRQFFEEMISQVEKAQESIEIGHLYFHPPEQLLKALIDASNRGVQISLITNQLDWDSPGSHLSHGALSSYYAKCLYEENEKPHVEHFEYNVPYTSYHKKVMIFDRKITLLGSANLGMKSLFSHDYEINVKVESEEFAQSVHLSLEEDKAYCIQDRSFLIPLTTSIWATLQSFCTPFL